MLRIPVVSEQKWYMPNDPDIEVVYNDLGHDYRPPKIKKGGDPAYVVVGQLSDAAFNQAQSLQALSDEPMPMELVEFLLRHGIKGWHGFWKGDHELGAPKFENGQFGTKLTKESYEAIIPFLGSYIAILAAHIFLLCLPKKS